MEEPMSEAAAILEENNQIVDEQVKTADDRAIDLGRERNKRKRADAKQPEPSVDIKEGQQILPTFEGIVLENLKVAVSGTYVLSTMLARHAEWREKLKLGVKGSMIVDFVVVDKNHGQKHDKDWNGLEGRETISLKVRAVTGVFLDGETIT